MFKVIIAIILLVCSLANSSQAEFTQAKFTKLRQKLDALVLPYGVKVGLCFIDLQNGKELQINGKNKFPAASVAKLPVMATGFHLAESGKLDLGQKVKFKEKDKLAGSGVLRWMKAGNAYTIKNLIRLTIVLSDNTATRMAVRQIGLEEINNYLKKCGLNDTVIVDDTMLNDPALTQNYNTTTPYDMARLVALIKNSAYFSAASKKQMLAYMKFQRYRWGLWKGVPKGIKIANKTGNLDRVLNDVGIVYAPSGNYALAIFTHGFQKNKTARKVINEISKVVYTVFESANK
ncbi:hypothetical protein A3H38_05795 [candidate division WOR-1 bacterium RIFCSPLOWO2_02_FULL_46_20]|uniref:Beta-lactamase class A catalytic domain-containing protein n=2 Tax=Saganbacteria TaxID=1703751 RepID=A0A1F4RBG8_UNCSA|nr:MAG: hypothetical protein A3J44_05095 [candidate division WOR-1 bacterium RIFCSPHIGHO2_02_FULL_45_12]OGC05476.1 MAG: hypothetical protein A3H38_05795 [candidate division WOR-1 bacterium RIFCSPLOWO2_02_FULL_46_20]OGC09075.1 MAG: hypothetical protein A3F86_01735 [candidate division WOR-1 bacterium RIFCSPLOWO2_12_FULL_45_9]